MSSNVLTPAAAPVEQEPRRKRAAWRPLAAAAIAGSVLVTTGFGVWASLSASATGVQNVETGTLTLAMSNNGVGFTQNISRLAPTDTVNRYVTLTNTGSIAGRDLTLSIAGTGDAVLLTGDKALRVTVSTCTEAWNPTDGSCAGIVGTLIDNALASTVSKQPVSTAALAADSAGKAHVRIATTLPNTDEHSLNGAPVAGTVQGKSAALTYTFNEVQRAGTTTTS